MEISEQSLARLNTSFSNFVWVYAVCVCVCVWGGGVYAVCVCGCMLCVCARVSACMCRLWGYFTLG